VKIVRIKFSPEAEEVYNYLNTEAPISKTERMILDAVNKKSQLVKANPHYGDPVAKKLIPQEYKVKVWRKQSVSRRTACVLADVIHAYEQRYGS